MLAETIEGWFEEKWQQGMKQGMQQGEGILLRRQLTRRFGVLPDDVVFRLAQANIEQLEIWGDRVLDAKTLDDIFQER